MRYPVFMSYPQPYNAAQRTFLKRMKKDLRKRDLEPRTLGATDYNMDAPLEGIRSLLTETHGLVAIALKRHHVEKGSTKPGSNSEHRLDGAFLTSPFCHIEPAMAFQMGLPALVFHERGVLVEGMLEASITGFYSPEIMLDEKHVKRSIDSFLDSREYHSLIDQFRHRVIQVQRSKGQAFHLYT